MKLKMPKWNDTPGLIYPPHISLEQCSSQLTAQYKKSLLDNNIHSLVDLTGGLAVDFSVMARNINNATYVEKNSDLAEIVAHNLKLLDLPNAKIVNSDAETFLQQMQPVDCIFIDPSRRTKNGSKAVHLTDCEPNIVALKQQLLNKAKKLVIKLSPMLDITEAITAFPEATSIHVIAVKNECKELLLVCNKITSNPQHLTSNVYPLPSNDYSQNALSNVYRLPSNVYIHTINFSNTGQQKFNFTRSEERSANLQFCSDFEGFLYEPNAAIMKAGAFKTIAAKYNIKKISQNTHLYISNNYINNFPGRVFQIDDVLSPDKKNFNTLQQANIAVRNFPLTVPQLRKKLQLADGGNVYLFAATTHKGQKLIFKCHKS